MGRLLLLLLVAVSFVVTGCETVQPARRSPARRTAPAPSSAVAARPPGPRQPVMQITAPPSPWKTEAERWYGTPYRYGGNDANGFDCSGFTTVLYRRVAGVNLPRTSQEQFHLGRGISQDDLRPGDLVFFRSPNSSTITHVGVYIGSSYFTHASTSRGVTFNSIKESYYRNNFHGARRVVGG
ncbi:peptidase P60 [Verrucomicrobiota bacterium]|nr:peptidase P60 [Verrucomicrobiota bacterium]